MVEIEDVTWAYRLLLGREPDDVHIGTHCQATNRVVLRDTFVGSQEFETYLARRGYIKFALQRCADIEGRTFFVTDQFLPALEQIVLARYRADVRAAIREILEPGAVFMDIGAGLGLCSLLASECVGPEGKVYAFEPHGATFEALTRTIRLSGKHSIVSCARVALGDKNSFARVAAPSVPDGRGARLTETSPERVPLCRLDNFCTERPVALISIDTNGNERAVLDGAIGLIRSHSPALLVPSGIADDISDLIARFGYAKRDLGEFVLLEAVRRSDVVAIDP